MRKVTVSEHRIEENSHLDLFFESADRLFLYTYECRSTARDLLLNGGEVQIIRKKDHRPVYLDFAGELTGNRGFIEILWQGEYNEEKFLFSGTIVIKMVLKNLHYIGS